MGYVEKTNFEYKIKDNSLCVSHADYQYLKNDKKIFGNGISLNLLNLILNDEDVFNYTVLVFSGVLKSFDIHVTNDNGILLRNYISKKNIYSAFVKAISSGDIEFTDKTRKNFHIFQEMALVSFYEQCHKNEEFVFDIEGVSYKFKVSDFFELLKMKPLELVDKITKSDELYGVKKEYFILALKVYFTRNYIASDYVFSSSFSKNYETLKKDLYVDTAALNVDYGKPKEEIEVDREFESYILNGIREDFTPLEKAVYIYLKMCKVLTYDEEFFAACERGKAALKHKNLKHLREINLSNNSVVCYEFCELYAYFLRSVGLSANARYSNEEYGSGHTIVRFRAEKYVGMADPLTSIFQGDLFGVKLNKEPEGLICFNNMAESQIEFRNTIRKMQEYVNCEEQFDCDTNIKNSSFDDLLSRYKGVTNNFKEIPLSERIATFFEKVKTMKSLKGIDVFSYIMMLCDMFFSEDERKNNVIFELVKTNDTKESDKELMPIGVLVVNTNGFSEISYENSYYLYSDNEGFEPISYYTLSEGFQSEKYAYRKDERINTIPGIDGTRGKTL